MATRHKSHTLLMKQDGKWKSIFRSILLHEVLERVKYLIENKTPSSDLGLIQGRYDSGQIQVCVMKMNQGVYEDLTWHCAAAPTLDEIDHYVENKRRGLFRGMPARNYIANPTSIMALIPNLDAEVEKALQQAGPRADFTPPKRRKQRKLTEAQERQLADFEKNQETVLADKKKRIELRKAEAIATAKAKRKEMKALVKKIEDDNDALTAPEEAINDLFDTDKEHKG